MDLNYKSFINQAERNEILVGVEPALARRFFTNTDRLAIQKEIGDSLLIERFFVKAVWILEFLFFLAGVIMSIFALKWYSIVAIVFMSVALFILGGKASIGKQKINGAIILLIIFLILAYFFRDNNIFMILWLVLLPFPYLFARLTYKLATIFLRLLVIRNEKAFNLLYNKAVFIKAK